MNKILVSIFGAGLIAFIYWFFLKKEDKAVDAHDAIDVIVVGGYSPEAISIPRGKTTTINFIRKDPNPCLEEVVLGDFHIRRALPLNQKVSVELTPQTAGIFSYACGMNMYHGKIIVT